MIRCPIVVTVAVGLTRITLIHKTYLRGTARDAAQQLTGEHVNGEATNVVRGNVVRAADWFFDV